MWVGYAIRYNDGKLLGTSGGGLPSIFHCEEAAWPTIDRIVKSHIDHKRPSPSLEIVKVTITEGESTWSTS